jgi:hypothetical protein
MVVAMILLHRALPLGLALLAALIVPAAAAGPATRPVVVELYTSQGCSSCPPADLLLGRLAQRPDVLALSLPITYWDMLGWKDTLASDANTRRQKAYAAAMGHGGVYTPQMIIDGALDVVGSRVTNVEIAIAERRALVAAAAAMARSDARYTAEIARAEAAAARAEAAADHTVAVAMPVMATAAPALPTPPPPPPPLPPPPSSLDPLVPVMVTQTPQEMHIDLGATQGTHNATVWMFHLRSQVSVNIPTGENAGHMVTYHNVVADLKAIGVYKGRALSLTLPRSAMAGLPHDGVAVVVQQDGYGHVIGAAYVNRPDYYTPR